MFDQESDRPGATLLAGLILLILLAAIAAISGEPEAAGRSANGGADVSAFARSGPLVARVLQVDWTRRAAPRRLTAADRSEGMKGLLRSLRPIGEPLAQCFGDDVLIAYDLGVAAAPAAEALAELLETSAPEVHAWIRSVLGEFTAASGLTPEADLLPYLGEGLAVGLLPAESNGDGWPLPRKVVLLRVLDEAAVDRYLRRWFRWEAGALAPATHGVLGASVVVESEGRFDLVGLRLNGLLPEELPLPSPAFVVADGFLIVSPVRSAVEETLGRLLTGCASLVPDRLDESTVEEVWLNFPAWPQAWRRAEPVLAQAAEWLGTESPAAIEIGRSLVALLGGLEPAHGTTLLEPEGSLVFRIELRPAER